MLSTSVLLSTIVYTAFGLAVFVLGFRLWDRLTPFDLWREICEKQNTAIAILASGVAIALALIISAAIHG